MIAQLRGRVEEISLDALVLLVGGVGYRVLVTPATAQEARCGDDVTLHTTLVVREDSLTLFGFRTGDERDVFERLQTVSGIGPRTALAALSVLGPEDLRAALAHQDLAVLQRIPGVGKKSAQRMVLDLGDKLGLPTGSDAGARPAVEGEAETEVRAALVQLGWTEALAQHTVDALGGQGLGASDLLRAALLKLGGSRG